MEFQKIVNFIGTISDNKDLPTFVTKNGLKFIMINQKEIYVILVTHILLLKEILLLLKKHLLLMTLMHLIIQKLT